MITQSQLKELFNYDADTGIFTRIKTICNCIAGSVAGSKHSHGYITIRVSKKRYYAHRLAWLYVYGSFPKNDIDHINGIKDDNRISNLRDVLHSVNIQNKNRALGNNTSGYLGVNFHKENNKYRATICVDGTSSHIGYFINPELAYKAYLTAKRKLHAGCMI